MLESYKAQAIFLSMVWMVSMVFSHEFVLSQAMILMVALALFERRPGFPWLRFRRALRENTVAWWRYTPNLMIAVPFLLVLVSALWSSDFAYTLERLRIKLPFLVLPWAFAGIPRLSRKEAGVVLYFLIGLMVLACLQIGVNYLMNFDEINQMIGMGKTIPTPSNHIRFSLVLCFAILSGIYLISERIFIRFAWERWLVLGMTLFLFVAIHALSMRSGLLALYAALFVWLIRYVVLTHRWQVALGMGVLLFLLPAAAYQVFPSFRAKVQYSRWDLLQYKEGKGENYSDSDRLTSLAVGWEVGKKAPVFGVGAGDLKKEVTQEYAEGAHSEAQAKKMPHNQYITIFAGTGIAGLAVFLAGILFPLFYRKNYRDPLLLGLYVVVMLSFMMENTIENNFGVSFFLLFLLLALNQLVPLPPPALQGSEVQPGGQAEDKASDMGPPGHPL